MENSIKSISTDLFYKIRSRFSGLKLGKETGETTINPEEAVFFDFDYMEGENPLGHVSISLAEPTSMKVYYSTGITENMSSTQKNGWYDFLGALREFAKRRLMNFDTRDIAKDNLDKRDFAFLSQYTNKAAGGENTMSESMYGTTKTSYQKLNDTKLIIKHKKQVDETIPGSRARNISALFVENQDGERFKYPFIHLAGARAMQRHVANGGVPYDDIGQRIISMSEQIAQLKSFDNYVVRNDLLNSDTNNIVERSKSELQRCREEIQRLSKQSYYEQFKENFQSQAAVEVPEDVIEELTNKFTVKNFKEDIKSVFPLIYKLMQEENMVGYDDIVEMTQEQAINDEAEIVEDHEDEFDKFESWVMNLGEASPIQSSDDEEQQQAIDSLNKLTKDHFPAGVDGQNAIQALKGIIEDPALDKALKQASKEDADSCVRPVVKQWLEQNAPDVLDQIDFGDMVEEPAKESEESAEEVPQQKSGVRELAEFINSFYDKESGTFPKGPEGVVTMVGKKFGEQAEQVARKFVERMAPQQSTEQNPELAELARVKELAGVKSSDMSEAGNTEQADPKELATMVKFLEDEIEAIEALKSEPDYDEEDIRFTDDLPDMQAKLNHLKSGNATPDDIVDALFDYDTEFREELNERFKEQHPELFAALMKRGNMSDPQELNRGQEESADLEDIRRLSGITQGGPEGVVTMVGKKFGEQAEQVARKFVERMAPQQTTDNNPELAELAKVKSLAGLRSEQSVTQESSGNYMWQEVGDEQDQRQLQRMAERVVKMYKHYGETSASDEEILSVLDGVVRDFVPQVGKINNVAPVSQAFFDKLPLKTVEPEYDDDGEEVEPESDPKSDMHDAIWPMVKITAAAEKGDTSSYGYKVHPFLNKESAELEAIKRLSGM